MPERRILARLETFFAQGSAADSIFFSGLHLVTATAIAAFANLVGRARLRFPSFTLALGVVALAC